jgi:LPXTG-motif cell wall-anchored protein
MENPITFHDIFDYYYPPFWQTTSFIIMVLIGLIIIAGLIALYFFLRKKNQVTPIEWALATIQSLKAQKRTTQKEYKTLYFDLTTTIKHYLHKEFLWKTVDKTDEELINYLTLQGIEEEQIEQFKKLMNGALYIKFANHEAREQQADDDIVQAESLIRAMQELHKQQQEEVSSSS